MNTTPRHYQPSIDDMIQLASLECSPKAIMDILEILIAINKRLDALETKLHERH